MEIRPMGAELLYSDGRSKYPPFAILRKRLRIHWLSIREVTCNNRIPAFHSRGNSHCMALILWGRCCKSSLVLFAEDFDTASEHVIIATVFWGLFHLNARNVRFLFD